MDAPRIAKPRRPHVVVVGGGFGGLNAGRRFAGKEVEVTLLDRRNHHLFQPLLYQVATAALSAPDVATPIRQEFRHQENLRVLMAEVVGVDPQARRVLLADGELGYDYLLVATGATHSYFGHDEWAAHAPGLKDIEDAFEIRRRILIAFEAAERESDPERRRALLTFVIVGGGPTGVELAGALREIATRTLARDFRSFDPRETRVVLLDAEDRVLQAFPPELSAKAQAILERRGVEVRTGARATDIDEDGVTVGDERIAARTVLWAAGVAPSPLARELDAELDGQGRVRVAPDLSVPRHPEIFVVGDLAAVRHGDGFVPGVAQGAIQEGRHAADNVLRRIAGRPTEPFRYKDLGSMATIGRSAAVAVVGRFRFAGWFAWMMWLGVHLFWLIDFRNRIAVLIDWSFAYLTYHRSARVILEYPAAATDSVSPPRAAERRRLGE